MDEMLGRNKKVVFLMAAIAFVLVTLGLLLKSNNPTPIPYGTIGGGSYTIGEEGYMGAPSIGKGAITDSTISSPQVSGQERQVIQTASLSLLVQKAEDAAKQISAIAKDFGGFTDSVNIYEETEDVKKGTIAIRVPHTSLDATVDKIKALAIKVEQEQRNAQDVTNQLVDIDARLRNFLASEQQYLKILTQAEKIEDILRVQQQIDQTRLQIELLEAQKLYLTRDVAMSVISVLLTSEPEVEIFGIQWRPFAVVKEALRSMIVGLQSYIDTLVKIIFQLPVLLAWLLTFLLVFLGLRKLVVIGKRLIPPRPPGL